MDVSLPRDQRSELAMLLGSGGDPRLDLDPHTGRNGYFCPLLPDPEAICFSSCTASPVSPEGFRAAGTAWRRVSRTSVAAEAGRTAATLRALFRLDGLAELLLVPSGTDATLLATALLVAERPGVALTSIMVAPGETGTGVPAAAAGRHFAGVTATGARVAASGPVDGFPPGSRTVTIAVRHADGSLRAADEVDRDFATAAASEPRPVVHLMEGSKTGLVAPFTLPAGAEVIVDACQARLSPERLRLHLRLGRPVLLTGSKFYGGSAFCGAVLFPTHRWAGIDLARLPRGLAAYGGEPDSPQPFATLGTVLRWAAALDEMKRFAAIPQVAARSRMQALGRAIASRLDADPGFVPFAAQPLAVDDWPTTIFSFAVCDPADRARLLTMPELRALQGRCADAGVLIGQPVAIAADHGALRIAVGARTVRDERAERDLERLFATLASIA